MVSRPSCACTPALPEIPLYSFASPARRAIYITVDDGWTPSPRVLPIMRQTHLPVTAFLIEQAAQRNLPYWRAFVRAGGTVGDHTVSHPNLTKLTLAQATAQWGQARRALGQMLGQVPFLGRPPTGPSTLRCRRRRTGWLNTGVARASDGSVTPPTLPCRWERLALESCRDRLR